MVHIRTRSHLLSLLYTSHRCSVGLAFRPRQAIVYGQSDAPEGTGAREHGRSMGSIRAGWNDGECSDEDG